MSHMREEQTAFVSFFRKADISFLRSFPACPLGLVESYFLLVETNGQLVKHSLVTIPNRRELYTYIAYHFFLVVILVWTKTISKTK